MKRLKPLSRKYSWEFDDLRSNGASKRSSGRFIKTQVHRAERRVAKRDLIAEITCR